MKKNSRPPPLEKILGAPVLAVQTPHNAECGSHISPSLLRKDKMMMIGVLGRVDCKDHFAPISKDKDIHHRLYVIYQ